MICDRIPRSLLRGSSLIAFGFHKVLEDIGTREIRGLLNKYPRGSWYRFIKQMNSYSYPKNSLSVFEPIRDSINEFKPFKLLDFQEQMLNNDKYS